MCAVVDVHRRWRPRHTRVRKGNFVNDPVRDCSSDDIVGLESFGIQSLKFGDQMNEGQVIKNKLQKGNGDGMCAFFKPQGLVNDAIT